MPYLKDKVPTADSKVKFRIGEDKHLHEGSYKNGKFETCNGFICVTISDVYYWRYA